MKENNTAELTTAIRMGNVVTIQPSLLVANKGTYVTCVYVRTTYARTGRSIGVHPKDQVMAVSSVHIRADQQCH
jgi:hypothetical protein